MRLYDPLFGDDDVDRLCGDRALMQSMLDVEAAVAEAAAEAGLVTTEAAAVVRDAARVEHLDLEALARGAAAAGNVAMPLVTQLTAAVARRDPRAVDAVHVGVTSQDVIDTAAVLQYRAALAPLLTHVGRASEAAAGLARRYRDTPMSGRTWLQQATPVTFGLKAAGWLAALDRGHRDVRAAAEAACVAQVGGGSGTLAALGDAGDRVARATAARLGLPLPAAPWHAHRDRLVRVAVALGVLTGTLGKIARDLALLAQPEVGEVREAPAVGRGGSSTMPHKQNPVSSAVALAASLRAPGLVATLLAAMPQEHERGLGGWQTEWTALPELLRITAGAARAMAEALEGLVVDADRMRRNLDRFGGPAQAEAVVVALAPSLGRTAARAIVERALARAATEGPSFGAALAADPDVTRVLDADALAQRLAPAHYLGEAGAFVDRVLESRRREGDG